MYHNVRIGRWGEIVARKHLASHGYKLLQVNYRCRFGEIDIIAHDKDVLVFVEVKTRKGTLYPGTEAINQKKMERMQRIALYFTQKNEYTDIDIRFDVVTIHSGKIELIKNAF